MSDVVAALRVDYDDLHSTVKCIVDDLAERDGDYC